MLPAALPAPVTLPWDAVSDAFVALEGAERHGDEEEITAAHAAYDLARDRMGLVSAAIFHAAVGGFGGTPAAGYVLPATLERFAELVPGLDEALNGWLKAMRMSRVVMRANRALCDELDAMRQRIKELEELVARFLPGIGEPASDYCP